MPLIIPTINKSPQTSVKIQPGIQIGECIICGREGFKNYYSKSYCKDCYTTVKAKKENTKSSGKDVAQIKQEISLLQDHVAQNNMKVVDQITQQKIEILQLKEKLNTNLVLDPSFFQSLSYGLRMALSAFSSKTNPKSLQYLEDWEGILKKIKELKCK